MFCRLQADTVWEGLNLVNGNEHTHSMLALVTHGQPRQVAELQASLLVTLKISSSIRIPGDHARIPGDHARIPGDYILNLIIHTF